ncbi:hypothetical protein DFH06DRAFT_1289638 [Mycena polygramma]|nr:hypothetical protein DFH06DRAFT_1289638 [Mycena polygramma]
MTFKSVNQCFEPAQILSRRGGVDGEANIGQYDGDVRQRVPGSVEDNSAGLGVYNPAPLSQISVSSAADLTRVNWQQGRARVLLGPSARDVVNQRRTLNNTVVEKDGARAVTCWMTDSSHSETAKPSDRRVDAGEDEAQME